MNTKSQSIALVLAITSILVLLGGCAHIGYRAPDESLQVTSNGRPAGAPATIVAAGDYQSDREASLRCDALVTAFLAGQVASVLCQSNGQTICLNTDLLACSAYGGGGYGVPVYGTALSRSAADHAESDAIRLQLLRAAQAIEAQQADLRAQGQEIEALEEDMEVILEGE